MLTYEDVSLEDVESQIRMYVLVRRDILPLVHCGVQAAHAVAEFVHYHQNENTKVWVTCEKTLIVLSATEEQIEEKMKQFSDNHMNYQPFYEPDMGNVMTAVAFQPLPKNEADNFFGDLKLLS